MQVDPSLQRKGLGSITGHLEAWNRGEETGLHRVIELVYGELHGMATKKLAIAQPGDTLQPTVMIHELFLKLIQNKQLRFENRYHFFAMAGRLMRQIIADNLRAKLSQKRGGDVQKVPLLNEIQFAGLRQDLEPQRFLALHDALDRLTRKDPRQAVVLEMRFIAGLKLDEIASLLQISQTTIKRELRIGKLWLAHQLGQSLPATPSGSS